MNATQVLEDVLSAIKIQQAAGGRPDSEALVSATRGLAFAMVRRCSSAIEPEDMHQTLLAWIVKQLNNPDRTVLDIAKMVPTVAFRMASGGTKGRQGVTEIPYDDAIEDDVERAPDVQSIYDTWERYQPLNRALDALKEKNPNQYWALVWHNGGYSDAEIKQRFSAMGVDSSQSLRTWRLRAKKFLASQLRQPVS